VGSDYFDCCALPTYVPCLALCAESIENWRLGPGGDDVRTSPYFTPRDDSPNYNQLFAALYDVIFSKLTKMGRLIPSPGRSLKDIFKEKVAGTPERHLISEELIAYLHWIIYVAAFKNRAGLFHEVFYNTKVAYLRSAGSRWRSELYIQLDAWYQRYPPGKKRSRSSAGKIVEEVGDFVRAFKVVDADEFVDPLAEPPQVVGREGGAAAAALASAAAAAIAAGGGGGGAAPGSGGGAQ